MKKIKVVLIISLVLISLLVTSSFVFANGSGDGKGKNYTYNWVCNRSQYSCNYSSNYRNNKDDFVKKFERWTETYEKETHNDYYSFNVDKTFDLYLDYLLNKDSDGDARIYVQQYNSGWRTIFYARHFRGSLNSSWGSYNIGFTSKVLRNLPPGTYRIRSHTHGHNGGWAHDNDNAYSVYSFGVVYSQPPVVNTPSLTYKEGEEKSAVINISNSHGLKCSGKLEAGMSLSESGGNCVLNWKPPYDINTNKTAGQIAKTVELTVETSGGFSTTSNLNIYVQNKPKPIENIDYENYQEVMDLPTPTINYNKPAVPKFDAASNLSSQTVLTDIKNYIFKEVEKTPPHPGDTPLMLASKRSSLVQGANDLIEQSLTEGDVNGYDSFREEIKKFQLVRDSYEELEEYLNAQYSEEELEEKLRFDYGLQNFVEYNNENNYLNKEFEIQSYKDYENMQDVYEVLKEELKKRKEKLDYNKEQYNKYVENINSYNADIEPEIESFIQKFNDNYIPIFTDWKSKRDDYISLLDNKINEVSIHNNSLYEQKVQEIEEGIEKYGLVSLNINDITEKPEESNLIDYKNTQLDNFDNDIVIPNIYSTISDNKYISEETKSKIKNKFSDGVYNNEKYEWFKNLLLKDMTLEPKQTIEYDEKYLIK